MKIDEIVVGDEYAYDARWKSERQRVRAVKVEKVATTSWRHNNTQLVRKVLVEVLDWDTGEPKLNDPMSDSHVRAAMLEPFDPVRDRLLAADARAAADKVLYERVAVALTHASVGFRDVSVKNGSVHVFLLETEAQELIEALS